MRQANFFRTQPSAVWCKAMKCVSAFVTLMSASDLYPGLPAVAGNQSQHSDSGTENSSLRRHQVSEDSRVAGSRDCGVIPCFYSYYLCRHGTDFLRLIAPALRLVTIALHARNAKNIFTEKIPLQLISIRGLSCNGGEMASIFRQNTSVSCAVHSSIDRLMLNRNCTPNFEPHRILWRLQLLREWSHEQEAKQVFTGSPRARSAPGTRAA